MYTEYMYQDSLAHHGIKGQRWGKRNGPPYPLDYESHSKKEKKLNLKSKIDGKDGFSLKKKKSKDKVEKAKKEKKHLTEKQKKILKGIAIGAGVAAAGAASMYAINKYNSNPALQNAVKDKLSSLKNKPVNSIADSSANMPSKTKVNDIIEDEPKSVSQDDNIKEPHIIGDNGRPIYTQFADGRKNELADSGISLIEGAAKDKNFREDIEGETMFWANKNAYGIYDGRHHNCISVALAADLRQKGYDVVGKEMIGDNKYNGFNVLRVYGKDALAKPKLETQGEWEKYFKSKGEGATGILGAFYKDPDLGAHFVNWKIEDGEIKIFDAQQNEMIDFDDVFEEGEDTLFNISKTYVIRTDNKTFDKNLITEYVEPNLGGFYNMNDDLADKYRDPENIPEKQRTATYANGKLIDDEYVVKKGYRYIAGPYEKVKKKKTAKKKSEISESTNKKE